MMNPTVTREILAMLEREDLPTDLQLVADVIGIDAVRRMLCELYGMTIYLRHPLKLRRLAQRYVVERYRVNPDGTTNLRELAVTLGGSPRYVRSLLHHVAS